MLEIKKTSKFSTIYLMNKENESKAFECINEQKIIQIVADEKYIAFEYIPTDYLDFYLGETVKLNEEQPKFEKTAEQMEYENALETKLNNDPLGRYSGLTLGEIFSKNDEQWIDWCIDHMQNKFIRDRIILINKRRR